MSADGDGGGGGGGGGTREVAYRLFAAEYDDATFSYSESDEERAPNYVVTPTGARVNRLFVVGVLTEIEPVNEEMLRARVVDPTGAFVVYAGQYQPDALAFLERTEPPAFVAVTGKARTFEPEDGDRIYTSVRPESISTVDADTRDRWVVQTAEQTLDRVETMAGALAGDRRGDELEAALRERDVPEGVAAGVPLAIDHYGTTATYLAAVRDLALDALRVVAGERDEVGPLSSDPDATGEVTPADLTDEPLTSAASTADASAVADESGSAEPATDRSAPESGGSAETDATAAETPDTAAADESEAPDRPSTVDAADETDAMAASDAAADADTELGAASETDVDTEAALDTGPDAAEEPVAESEPEAATVGDAPVESAPEESAADSPTAVTEADEEPADDADELGEFDGEFELDEEERAELEEEFGTEFETGTEVGDPGEAGIEPEAPAEPEGETAAEPEPEPADPGAADEATAAAESDDVDESDADGTDEADEAAVDVDEAVVETMRGLDDGDGADREAVVEAVVDEYGLDRDAVEDAIQDALMSGQCYEPEEGRLKAI